MLWTQCCFHHTCLWWKMNTKWKLLSFVVVSQVCSRGYIASILPAGIDTSPLLSTSTLLGALHGLERSDFGRKRKLTRMLLIKHTYCTQATRLTLWLFHLLFFLSFGGKIWVWKLVVEDKSWMKRRNITKPASSAFSFMTEFLISAFFAWGAQLGVQVRLFSSSLFLFLLSMAHKKRKKQTSEQRCLLTVGWFSHIN